MKSISKSRSGSARVLPKVCHICPQLEEPLGLKPYRTHSTFDTVLQKSVLKVQELPDAGKRLGAPLLVSDVQSWVGTYLYAEQV